MTTPIPQAVPERNPEPAPLEGNPEQPQASRDGGLMEREVGFTRLHRDRAIAVVNAQIEDDIPELPTQPEVVAVAATIEEAPGRAFISNDQDPVVILAIPIPPITEPRGNTFPRHSMDVAIVSCLTALLTP